MSGTGPATAEAAGMNAEEVAAAKAFVAPNKGSQTGAEGGKGGSKKRSPSIDKSADSKPTSKDAAVPTAGTTGTAEIADAPVITDATSSLSLEPDTAEGREGEAEGDEPTRESEPKTQVERRQLEMGIVARSALLAEARKTLIGPDGTLKEPLTDREKALRVYYEISTTQEGGAFGVDDNPLVLPKVDGIDQDGSPVSFGVGRASVREIVGVAGDGSFKCIFSDETGIPITKTVTDPETGASSEEPIQITLPREVVLDAQILSQRELYEGAVEGDQKTVVASYLDTLPQSGVDLKPGADLDSAIEAAAQENGFMTVNQVRESTFFSELSDENQARLSNYLKGKTVLTSSDMVTLMNYTGADRVGVRREVKSIIGSISELERRTDEVGMRELAEAQARLKALEQLDNAWGEAETNGATSPYERILQEIQDGRRTPEEAKAINNAILNGDHKGLMELLPVTKNMSDKEKQMWLDYAKKTGIGAGILAAILLAIPAALVYAGGQLVISNVSGRR